MKGRGGPSFFDVLRSAAGNDLQSQGGSVRPTPPAEPSKPAPLKPPAAAAVEKPATPAPRPIPQLRQPEQPAPRPPQPPPMRTPPPDLVEDDDPDHRVIRISHTAGLFAALVGLIVLMGSFYTGLRIGRASTAEAAEPAARQPVQPEPAPTAQAPASADWALLLLKWPADTDERRRVGEHSAQTLVAFLSGKGHPDAYWRTEGGEVRLFYGAYASRSDQAGKQTLATLQDLQYAPRGRTPQRIFQRAGWFKLTPG